MFGVRFAAALEGTEAFKRSLDGEARAVGDAVRGSVEDTSRAVQLRVRLAVNAAIPASGARQPGNAIRRRVYRDAEGVGVAAIVYSRLGRREDGRFVDYLRPHAEGAVFRPTDGRKYMVVPVKGVSRRLKQKYRQLDGLGTDPKLRLIPVRGGRLLFVRQTRTRTTLLATLVRRVVVRQTLDVDDVTQGASDDMARDLARRLET